MPSGNLLRRAWLQYASTAFANNAIRSSTTHHSPPSSTPDTLKTSSSSSSTTSTVPMTKDIDPSFAIQTRDKHQENVGCLSGVNDVLQSRYVRIYKPAKTAMQSGEHCANHWLITFDTQDRWQNPLIGWTSSADPMQATTIEFESKESAIRFANNQGWQYKVIDPPTVVSSEKKSYADNFVYSPKKLRLYKTK